QGQAADADSILVRQTLAGDATLDGIVDSNDLVHLAQNYNTTVSTITDSWWYNGDFTYDGIVDFNDLVRLAQNYNTALPSEPVPGASVSFNADLAAAFAAVPEPASPSSAAATASRSSPPEAPQVVRLPHNPRRAHPKVSTPFLCAPRST